MVTHRRNGSICTPASRRRENRQPRARPFQGSLVRVRGTRRPFPCPHAFPSQAGVPPPTFPWPPSPGTGPLETRFGPRPPIDQRPLTGPPVLPRPPTAINPRLRLRPLPPRGAEINPRLGLAGLLGGGFEIPRPPRDMPLRRRPPRGATPLTPPPNIGIRSTTHAGPAVSPLDRWPPTASSRSSAAWMIVPFSATDRGSELSAATATWSTSSSRCPIRLGLKTETPSTAAPAIPVISTVPTTTWKLSKSTACAGLKSRLFATLFPATHAIPLSLSPRPPPSSPPPSISGPLAARRESLKRERDTFPTQVVAPSYYPVCRRSPPMTTR